MLLTGRGQRRPARRAVHDLPRGLQLIYSQAQEDARQGLRDEASALTDPRALMLTPCPSRAPPQQEQRFKALKSRGSGEHEQQGLLDNASLQYGGFQAGKGSQEPPTLFPGSLASYVLVFQMDEEWHHANLYYPKAPKNGPEISYGKLNMQPLVDKLRSADMIVRELYSSAKADKENEMPYFFALVSIGEKRQMTVAEIMGKSGLIKLRMRKMDDIGNEIKNGGAWTTFKQHLSQYLEKSSEGTLFSSAQQQQMMEFLMHDADEAAMGPQLLQKEACVPGNNVLQQLVVDARIVAYFPLHHPAKRKWLKTYWVDSYLTRQPIEDIREYFGEEVTLFFVWFGYLCTMLWIPAGVGVWVFVMQMLAQGESGSMDNPYNPLFAGLMAVWGIMFCGGYKRLQLVYQHEWDTVHLEPANPDRRDFVQSASTYKMLNTVSKKEEYYPDPIFRVLWLVVSTAVICILVVLNMIMVLLVQVVMHQLFQLVGIPQVGVVIAAIMQGGLIVGFRLLAKKVSGRLNDNENWKTEAQYATAFYSKLFAFGCINSYSALFFFAFMSNDFNWFGLLDFDLSCPGRDCFPYVGLLAVTLFVQLCIIKCLPQMGAFFTKYLSTNGSDETDDAPTPSKGCKCTKCMKRELSEDEKAAEISMLLPSFQCQLTKEQDKGENGVPPETLDDHFFDNVMDLGFILLFGATCPLLPLLLLIYCLVELRQKAHHFLFNVQRPRYVSGKGIGKWEDMVDILVIISIISQSSYMAFVSKGLYYYFPYMTNVDKTFYAVMIEHLLLLFKILYDGATAHVPQDVTLAYQIKSHERELALETFDTMGEDNVKFYTDEEGFPYYG